MLDTSYVVASNCCGLFGELSAAGRVDGEEIDFDCLRETHWRTCAQAVVLLPRKLYSANAVPPRATSPSCSLSMSAARPMAGWHPPPTDHRRGNARRCCWCASLLLAQWANHLPCWHSLGEGPNACDGSPDHGIRGNISTTKSHCALPHSNRKRYTRAGAAIRHATGVTDAQRQAGHRLLLLLSDGKPNDVDLYEGRYGIEDMRQAVSEARMCKECIRSA